MTTHPFLNSCCLVGACFLGFLHSSSSSSVSCSHLSLTALYSNLPYLKMANFRKALNTKSMFIGLNNLVDQPGSAVYFRLGNSLKYANPTTVTLSMLTIDFAGNKLGSVAISVLSGNSLSVFWEIHAYIHASGRFSHKYSQIRTVGRYVYVCN